LAAGASAADAGPAVDSIVELGAPPLHKQGGVVEGQVIHVDSFGNLITSLPAELLAGSGAGAGTDVQIEVEGTEGTFRPVFGRTFSDVLSGALIAYIGSGGQLEIARRDGSAAARVGAGRGTAVRVTIATT
jgi:S-adenosylmethionine hydrolase